MSTTRKQVIAGWLKNYFPITIRVSVGVMHPKYRSITLKKEKL
jgi:hypothetical protein